MEIKGLVVKWQRALVTPFRNGGRPITTGSDGIYRQKNNVTCERYIDRKKETILTRLSYFLSASGRVSLYDDSFQSESPCKPVKN